MPRRALSGTLKINAHLPFRRDPEFSFGEPWIVSFFGLFRYVVMRIFFGALSPISISYGEPATTLG